MDDHEKLSRNIYYGGLILAAIYLFSFSPSTMTLGTFGNALQIAFGGYVLSVLPNIWPRDWAESFRQADKAYLVCYAIALIIMLTDLIKLELVIMAAFEIGFTPFVWLGNQLASGLQNDSILIGLFFCLLLLGLVVVMIAIWIPITIIICLLLFLEWLGEVSVVFWLVQCVIYAFGLAYAIYCLIFIPFVNLLGKLWPTAAVLLNDAFIAVPDDAARQLMEQGQVSVRVRNPWELGVAVVSALLAVLSTYLRMRTG